MTEHEEWDPTAVRKVDDIDGMRMLIFDALSEHLARMCCGCDDCSPAPHEDTGLGTFSGVIEAEIDGKTYKITVEEIETRH